MKFVARGMCMYVLNTDQYVYHALGYGVSEKRYVGSVGMFLPRGMTVVIGLYYLHLCIHTYTCIHMTHRYVMDEKNKAII